LNGDALRERCNHFDVQIATPASMALES
jgi:hypothetical protein